MDDLDMMLFDKVIVYDHLKQKICIVVNMNTERLLENYGRAVSEIERTRSSSRPAGPLPRQRADKTSAFLQCF